MGDRFGSTKKILKAFLQTPFVWALLSSMLLSGCTFEAKVKNNSSAPSSGSGGDSGSPSTISAAITSALSPINASNQSAYAVSGTCSNTNSITLKVNTSEFSQDIPCSAGSWSAVLDLSNVSLGNATITIHSSASSDSLASNNVTVDSTNPTLAGSITDGTYFNSTSQSTVLSWTAASDAHSGIQKYQIALGTSSGATNVLNWTDIGNVTSHTLTGLSLSNGSTYYPSVRAVDVAANTSSAIVGDGWIVDTVVPSAPSSLNDGKVQFSSANTPIFNWSSSSDATSGVQGYQLAVGTSSGGTNILNWTSVGDILTTTLSSLSLSGSTKYYASVRAVDNSGNASSSTLGDSWYNFSQTKLAVDSSTPQPRSLSSMANFGSSAAVSEDGSTLVIGAKHEDYDSSGINPVSDAGAVFVFIKSGGTWIFQQKITPLNSYDRASSDYFGGAVAISNDTIVVGATGNDLNESGGGYMSTAGAIFIFTRTAGVWSQQQKIVPTGTNARVALDYFGNSISLHADTLAVAARQQDYDEAGANSVSNAGAVYVFTRTAGVWSQQQKIIPTGTNARVSSDMFGTSVSVDTDTLIVGAYMQGYDAAGGNLQSSAGAAYVFTRTAGVWSQQQKIIPTGTNARVAGDNFGYTVSINGESVAVAASGQDYDEAGANSVSNAGAVYVFTRTAGVWSQQQKIIPTGTNARVASDQLGLSTVIRGNDLIATSIYQSYDATGGNFIGGAGAGFYFSRSGSSWTQQQKVVDNQSPGARMDLTNFGRSMAISEDGNTLVIGSLDGTDASGLNYMPGAGSVYVYVKSGGNWILQQKLIPTGTNAREAGDFFGYSVSISNDTIVVGAESQGYDAAGANLVADTGAAYVFTRTAGVWSQQQKIVATGTNARISSDRFGYKVSIHNDTIAVASMNNDYDASGANLLNDAGAVFVYTRTAGVWSQQQKIVATGTNARTPGSNFGWGLALNNDTLVVGAPIHEYDETGGNNLSFAGAVFVYTRTAGVWSQQQKIVPTGTNARGSSEMFGIHIALENDLLAINSNNGFDESGNNFIPSAGAVFVYTRTAGIWSQQQKLIAAGTNARVSSSSFGNGLSMHNNTMIIGSSGNGYDAEGANLINTAGAAYVFTKSGSTWTQQLKITATGSNSRGISDLFGLSVVIHENTANATFTLGIGAPQQDYDSTGSSPANNSGAAFIYH